MAMCTAFQSCLKMYHNIYDAQDIELLWGSPSGDNGTLKLCMIGPYMAFQALQLFSDNENINPVLSTRAGCDTLNKMLSLSQQAMFLTACADTKEAVMRKVVREANRKATAWGSGDQFTLNPFSYSSLMLPAFVEFKPITVDQVRYYMDPFSRADAFWFLPGLGRGVAGGGWGEEDFILVVYVSSSGVDVNSAGSKMTASEDVSGYYVFFIVYVYGIPVPIGSPITGKDVDITYNVKNDFDHAKVYQLKAGLSDENLEPSSLAIVQVEDSKIPWYPNMGLKPSDLSPGDSRVLAFSRAKAYFRGVSENLSGGVYNKPHTSYPDWGAKLAPLKESSGAWALAQMASGAFALDPDVNY